MKLIKEVLKIYIEKKNNTSVEISPQFQSWIDLNQIIDQPLTQFLRLNAFLM